MINFAEMIQKKEERKAALVAKSKDANIEELRSIQEQIQVLNEDIMELRLEQSKQEMETKMAEQKASQEEQIDERTDAVNNAENFAESVEKRGSSPSYMPGSGFISSGENRGTDYQKMLESREQAGTSLKEGRAVVSDLRPFSEVRAVTIGTGTTIILPKYDSPTIEPDFNIVSSLIDRVKRMTLDGGESFEQAYIDEIELGGYTNEGANAVNADTKYAYATIGKAKVTAYSEITEELEKLPVALYADTSFANIRTSMRAIITKQILLGNGNKNQITGIFSSNATAIDSNTDLAISTIDDTTLNKIVYNYGGAEDVEDAAVLILSKLDLLNFANVRTNNKESFYKIESKGNYGTINGIPYIINSGCKSLTATTTAANDYVMVYGNLSNYLLCEFSPTTVKRSDDVKFREGMIAFKGTGFVGGNVIKKNGFLRIKKK